MKYYIEFFFKTSVHYILQESSKKNFLFFFLTFSEFRPWKCFLGKNIEQMS